MEHAACVALLASKLAPPSPPRQEVALWAIASCDTLSRAPSCAHKISTKSLWETCEAVRELVEVVSNCVSLAAELQPLSVAERSTVKMMSGADRKYFYILAMSMKLESAGELVRVAPSQVHGSGVFAAEDIPRHTCCTPSTCG